MGEKRERVGVRETRGRHIEKKRTRKRNIEC